MAGTCSAKSRREVPYATSSVQGLLLQVLQPSEPSNPEPNSGTEASIPQIPLGESPCPPVSHVQVLRGPIDARVDDNVVAPGVILHKEDVEIRRDPRIQSGTGLGPRFRWPTTSDRHLHVDLSGAGRRGMSESDETLELALIARIIASGDHENLDVGAELLEMGADSPRLCRSADIFSIVVFHHLGLSELSSEGDAPSAGQGFRSRLGRADGFVAIVGDCYLAPLSV
ncbi:hypothetical protein FOBRF1_009045 [Fusarium oxysporum]